MNFLDKIYQNLSNLGSKFPPVDATILYVILLCSVFVSAIICFALYFLTPCHKLAKRSKKITKYLGSVPMVTKANREAFISEYFSAKCPKSLFASWQVFDGVRYGYPSEFVSKSSVYDKSVKSSAYPMFVFGVLAVFLIVLLGIMFAGVASLSALFIGILIAFAFAVVLEVVLFVLFRVMRKSTLKAFDEMQDALDSKIMLQELREFVPETQGLSAIADELDKLAGIAQKHVIPENYEEIVPSDSVEIVLEKPENIAAEVVDHKTKAEGSPTKSVQSAEVKAEVDAVVNEQKNVAQKMQAEVVSKAEQATKAFSNVEQTAEAETIVEKQKDIAENIEVEVVEQTADEVGSVEQTVEVDVVVKEQEKSIQAEAEAVDIAQNEDGNAEQTAEVVGSVEQTAEVVSDTEHTDFEE